MKGEDETKDVGCGGGEANGEAETKDRRGVGGNGEPDTKECCSIARQQVGSKSADSKEKAVNFGKRFYLKTPEEAARPRDSNLLLFSDEFFVRPHLRSSFAADDRGSKMLGTL